MNMELLEQAKKNLFIQGVNLREMNQNFNEDFEPGFSELEMKLQFRAGPSKQAKEFQHADSNSRTVRFYYSCGFRAVMDPDDSVMYELNATFTADYIDHCEVDVTNECLAEFARVNVGYHVWPYWRELVQSFNSRSGMPAVNIPFYQLPE